MKARSGYKHFANRFGGYHAECTGGVVAPDAVIR